MGKHFLYLFIFFLVYQVSGQTTDPYYIPATPPGTLKLNDSLYIDKTPVTNQMYREFLASLENFWSPEKHDSIIAYPKFNLDKKIRESLENRNTFTTVDRLMLKKKVFADKDYLFDTRYNNHPVLNISREEAEMFCLWRTDMVMLLWAYNSDNEEERSMFPSEVKYRLPKLEEYQEAVNFFSNRNKIEMTREKSPLRLKLKVNKPQTFTLHRISEFTLGNSFFWENWRSEIPTGEPNDYTGFRCVCEVNN